MAHALYKSHHMRAEGNLQYLDFIKLVHDLWTASHPDIDVRPVGSNVNADEYPVILYSLQVRRPHPNEPKPRYREEIRTAPSEDAIIISAQRFQNIVNFTPIAEVDTVYPRANPFWHSGVEVVENLIEEFENFMLEMTPVFKEMGVSEFVYARRQPDDEETRQGDDVRTRTVSYMVTTEKIRQTTEKKLNNFVLHARLALQDRPFATVMVVQTEPGAPDAILLQTEDPDVWVAPVRHLQVRGASFNPGDAVMFERIPGYELPLVSMPPAVTDMYPFEDSLGVAEGTTFYVLNTHETNVGLEYSFTTAAGYRVQAASPSADVAIRFVRSGSVYVVPQVGLVPQGDGSMEVHIEDDFQSAPAG